MRRGAQSRGTKPHIGKRPELRCGGVTRKGVMGDTKQEASGGDHRTTQERGSGRASNIV